MSTSVPPRDGTTPTGPAAYASSAIPDEQALRRLFDAEYATYLASAKSQLGEATALAARVVETAFVNAWTQRAALRDAAGVKTFLTDEVRHGAARALSRRSAAHRFGSHGGREETSGTHAAAGDISQAAAWSEVEKAIHGAGATGAAHAAAAGVSRHEAAAHMKSVGKGRSWLVPAIGGLIVLAGLGYAGYYFDQLGADDAILTAVGSTTMQPLIQSSPGQIGNTKLSDGTQLKIGPDSKVFAPDGFPSKIRAIRFEGTAQFDVPATSDPKALLLHVVALHTHFIGNGSSFVLTAFPNDSSAMLLVKQGSVTVKSDKTTQTVAAGQSLAVDKTGFHAPTEAQAAEAFSWADGHVTSNRHLRDAQAALLRWYTMDVKVPDTPLLDRDASFSASLDSARVAIAQIEKSAGVKFGYEGENRAFRDATGKIPPNGKLKK